jgi:uncharacterized LabA/DUF88 family protein
MRTYAYVDGFNLYFGALRRTRYRWLNLQRLCELMLAAHNRTVLKTEEKGSDVNLATHLVHDAHLDRFDLAVIISNDSDLLEAVRIVKGLGKKVGVLNPHKHPSRALLREATFMKPIRQGPLSASQFPDYLKDATGSFHKPVGW